MNDLEDICLTGEEFRNLVIAGRDLLREQRDNYKGVVAFEEDLAGLSGVECAQIETILNADNNSVRNVLNGLEWERILSAAHVYPEDLLKAADLSYSGIVVSPSTGF